MKRLPYLFLLLVAFLTACSNRNVDPDYSSWSSIKQEFLKVMMDTSVTWQQVEDITRLVADSLKAFSADPEDLDKRIFAQRLDFVAFELLNEKYENMIASGKEVKAQDVLNLQDLIHSATVNWFYTEEDGSPLFWRDHFYISYKDSENPQEDYFHIIVSIPTEDNPVPGLHIFFPESAEGNPSVLFCKTVDDAAPENIKEDNIIHINNFIPKDGLEEGYPMYVSLAEDYLQQVFENSAMLIGFASGTSPSGEPGQQETAYISLEPLQDLAAEMLGVNSSQQAEMQEPHFKSYEDSVAYITGIPWFSPYFYDPSWGIMISETKDTLFYYPRYDTLKNYVMPSTIKVIDDRAFQCNHYLENIVVPKGVTKIGIRAFHLCGELRSVVIQGSVDSLKWMAFDGCKKLESVDLPKTLSYIDGFAFSYCDNLRKFIVRNPVPPVIEFIGDEDIISEMDPEWAFSNVPLEECTLIVPRGAVPSYKKARGWKLFGKIIELPVD